jgi:hypothetical protein
LKVVVAAAHSKVDKQRARINELIAETKAQQSKLNQQKSSQRHNSRSVKQRIARQKKRLTGQSKTNAALLTLYQKRFDEANFLKRTIKEYENLIALCVEELPSAPRARNDNDVNLDQDPRITELKSKLSTFRRRVFRLAKDCELERAMVVKLTVRRQKKISHWSICGIAIRLVIQVLCFIVNSLALTVKLTKTRYASWYKERGIPTEEVFESLFVAVNVLALSMSVNWEATKFVLRVFWYGFLKVFHVFVVVLVSVVQVFVFVCDHCRRIRGSTLQGFLN